MKAVITIVIAVALSAGAAFGIVSHETKAPAPSYGALAGPDISSPYLSWGGVADYKASASMRTATTTLCAIQSPSATSSLVMASWKISAGTTTAATIDLATSTSRFATTTNLIAGTSVASGAQGSAAWRSSGSNSVLAPNTYVVVKTAGAGSGGYTYGGQCEGEFQVL